MASKLKLSTIQNQDGSKEVPSETVIAGSAKAWALFDTITTTTLLDSFNVLSLTDLGAGQTTVNFINNMPSANFAAPATCSGSGSAFMMAQTTNFAVSSVDVVTRRSNDATVLDTNDVSVAVSSN